MAARSEASGGGRKSAGVLRVVGVVALVAIALAIGAVRMGLLHLPGSHDDDSMLAKGDDGGATYATPAPAKPAPAPAEGVNLDAPAEEPGAPAPADAPTGHRPGSRLASSASSRGAVVTAVTFGAGERRSGVVTGEKCSRCFGWHELPRCRRFLWMESESPRPPRTSRSTRHQVERRVRPDRRSGLDRRVTDRRARQVPVLVERRGRTERRSRVERRSPQQRRQLKDRRGSGLSFTSS